jgi:hypothetical protein
MCSDDATPNRVQQRRFATLATVVHVGRVRQHQTEFLEIVEIQRVAKDVSIHLGASIQEHLHALCAALFLRVKQRLAVVWIRASLQQ